MTEVNTLNAVETETEIETAVDRRRPERRDVNTHLIPLLRAPMPGNVPIEPDATAFAEDDLAAARGIGLALLLSVPIWAGLIGLFRLAF